MFCIQFALLITFYINSGTFITINEVILIHWGFPQWLRSKESACNSGHAGDLGLIPGLEDSLKKELAPHSSILAWEIPLTEKTGSYSLWGRKSVRHD